MYGALRAAIGTTIPASNSALAAVGVLCTHERQERSSIAAVSSAAKAARRPAAREAAAVRRLAAPLTGVSRQQAS